MNKEIIIPHEIEILFKDAMENRTAEFDVLDKAFYDFCDSIVLSSKLDGGAFCRVFGA